MKKLLILCAIFTLTSCFDVPIKYPIVVTSVEKVDYQKGKYKVGVEQSDYKTEAYIYTDEIFTVGDTIK